MRSEPAVVLLVDDDADDCFLLQETFKKTGGAGKVVCVDDGEELLDYLKRRGKFADLRDSALPSLILLDLNLPGRGGHEVLRELKGDSELRAIPVVVMTASLDEENVRLSYDMGASSFIGKPKEFFELQRLVKTISQYWLGLVRLPS